MDCELYEEISPFLPRSYIYHSSTKLTRTASLLESIYARWGKAFSSQSILSRHARTHLPTHPSDVTLGWQWRWSLTLPFLFLQSWQLGMGALHTEGCRNIRCQDLSSALPVGAEVEVVKTKLSLVKPFQLLLELGFSSLSSSKYLVMTCTLLLASYCRNWVASTSERSCPKSQCLLHVYLCIIIA